MRQVGSGTFETPRRHSDVPPPPAGFVKSHGKPLDDMSDVKPGIMEMIQEERRVRQFCMINSISLFSGESKYFHD